jgi:hypothetical protein
VLIVAFVTGELTLLLLPSETQTQLREPQPVMLLLLLLMCCGEMIAAVVVFKTCELECEEREPTKTSMVVVGVQ